MVQKQGAGCAVLAFSSPVIFMFGLMFLAGGGELGPIEAGTGAACGAHAGSGPAKAPSGAAFTDPIAGYPPERLPNAVSIIQAGADAGLNSRDVTIGLMVAMGESSLENLDHGDAAGPDSRGLFQQRDLYGPESDRMDPYKAATMFFNELVTIDGRETMEPTLVANAVQGNADPYHYEKHWEPAKEMYAALSGEAKPQACGSATGVVAGGWAAPSTGAITEPFGMRMHPLSGEWKMHYGVDLNAGCNEPIFAVHDGVVTRADFDDYGNGIIDVDHGGGIVSAYWHEEDPTALVSVGTKVTAGQQIGYEGTSGQSTGCHLHFEIRIDGTNVDPAEFMAQQSIKLG